MVMACGPGASARYIGVALRAAVYAASRCPCPCEFKPAPPGPPAVIINYRRRRCPAQQSLGAVTWTSTRMSSRWHQALAPINGSHNVLPVAYAALPASTRRAWPAGALAGASPPSSFPLPGLFINHRVLLRRSIFHCTLHLFSLILFLFPLLLLRSHGDEINESTGRESD